MKWQAIASPAINIRCWGDECVIYHTASGNTHLLGSTAAQILRNLQTAPADVPAMAQSIAGHLQIEVDQDLLQQVEDIVAELDALALIKQI